MCGCVCVAPTACAVCWPCLCEGLICERHFMSWVQVLGLLVLMIFVAPVESALVPQTALVPLQKYGTGRVVLHVVVIELLRTMMRREVQEGTGVLREPAFAICHVHAIHFIDVFGELLHLFRIALLCFGFRGNYNR
jgi:hypothetical protein